MQRVDAIIWLISTFYLAPGIEEIVGSKQCTVFVVHAIANHHKGIITKQLWYIPAIANRQLRIGIHDGGIRLDSALKLQYHYRQTIYTSVRDKKMVKKFGNLRYFLYLYR